MFLSYFHLSALTNKPTGRRRNLTRHTKCSRRRQLPTQKHQKGRQSTRQERSSPRQRPRRGLRHPSPRSHTPQRQHLHLTLTSPSHPTKPTSTNAQLRVWLRHGTPFGGSNGTTRQATEPTTHPYRRADCTRQLERRPRLRERGVS